MPDVATASEALERNKHKLPEVLDRYGVGNPRLFGSLARGEASSASDIDILVTKSRPLNYAAIARLRREVAKVFGWQVDLVFESALKPEVSDGIASDLRPIL